MYPTHRLRVLGGYNTQHRGLNVPRPYPLLCERIQQTYACLSKVCLITGDDCEIIDQRRCSDLLIQGIFWVRHSQAAPELCNVYVNSQYTVLIFCQQRL
jgi:hypothetical protein